MEPTIEVKEIQPNHRQTARHPGNERRERRFERRRNEILLAAAKIFAEKGYASTTTKDIADAVDLGESTLYNYFPGKRDILLEIIAHKRQEMDVFLVQIEQVESISSLVDFIERSIDHWVSKVEFTRTIFGEARIDPNIFQVLGERLQRMHDVLEGYLARQVASGAFRPMDTALTARMIMGMYAGLLMPIVYGAAPVPSSEQRRAYALEMASLMVHGLIDPKKGAH